MATVNSFPQEQYQYCQDSNGDIACGKITFATGADIEQINIACYLEGNFTDKQIKLTLQSTSDVARVFEFFNTDLNLTGDNFCYVSFVCENFHAKDSDEYEATLSMTPAVDAKLFAIADFTPENNTSNDPGFVPAARFEAYER